MSTIEQDSGPAHGTLYRYTHWGCDCDPCRDCANAYRRRVHRLRSYGRWQPYVDATPVRAHVQALRASGLGIRRIAELAGVGHTVVRHLIYGAPAAGQGPSKQMRPANASALLAVRPTLADYPPTALVDATGTRRRLQALTALGWPGTALSAELGRPPRTASDLRSASQVEARTALAVRALYDRLWDQEPPRQTQRQKADATKARALAERRGWVPPLAWDEESIDDPEASPADTTGRARAGRLPESGELLWLVEECGESEHALAARFSVTVSGVRQALYRAREEAAS